MEGFSLLCCKDLTVDKVKSVYVGNKLYSINLVHVKEAPFQDIF